MTCRFGRGVGQIQGHSKSLAFSGAGIKPFIRRTDVYLHSSCRFPDMPGRVQRCVAPAPWQLQDRPLQVSRRSCAAFEELTGRAGYGVHRYLHPGRCRPSSGYHAGLRYRVAHLEDDANENRDWWSDAQTSLRCLIGFRPLQVNTAMMTFGSNWQRPRVEPGPWAPPSVVRRRRRPIPEAHPPPACKLDTSMDPAACSPPVALACTAAWRAWSAVLDDVHSEPGAFSSWTAA